MFLWKIVNQEPAQVLANRLLTSHTLRLTGCSERSYRQLAEQLFNEHTSNTVAAPNAVFNGKSQELTDFKDE